MNSFTESVVEDAALAWLESLGYAVLHGPDIAVGEIDVRAWPLPFLSSSRIRNTRRCTLPVVVIGRASMNSISLGYS
jgi:uncharacterized MnhB-related membrane protein